MKKILLLLAIFLMGCAPTFIPKSVRLEYNIPQGDVQFYFFPYNFKEVTPNLTQWKTEINANFNNKNVSEYSRYYGNLYTASYSSGASVAGGRGGNQTDDFVNVKMELPGFRPIKEIVINEIKEIPNDCMARYGEIDYKKISSLISKEVNSAYAEFQKAAKSVNANSVVVLGKGASVYDQSNVMKLYSINFHAIIANKIQENEVQQIESSELND